MIDDGVAAKEMMKRLSRPKLSVMKASRILLVRQKGQPLSWLTFQADLLAAKVEQGGVVSRIGRGHVQLHQYLDFGTLVTRAEKANTGTQNSTHRIILYKKGNLYTDKQNLYGSLKHLNASGCNFSRSLFQVKIPLCANFHTLPL